MRVLCGMFIRSRNRPEPFKTYDRPAHRPRWGLRVFAGIAVFAAGALLAVLMGGAPRGPVPSSEAPIAAVRTVPAPTPPRADPPPDSAPVSVAPPLEPAVPVAPPAPPAPEPQPAVQQAVQPPPSPPPEAAREIEAAREVVTTGRGGSNMRSAPSMSGSVLWTAPFGTRFRVLGEEGTWMQVETPDGERTGWIHGSLLAGP
jgi:type IV secretory pathway VirB10-like protein